MNTIVLILVVAVPAFLIGFSAGHDYREHVRSQRGR